MSIQTATDYIAARAFTACYSPHWLPRIEAIIGRRMVRDARAAGHQPRRPKTTSRSERARRMIAAGADVDTIAIKTGLSRVTVRALFNGKGAATGLKHGGRRPSPAGIEARKMAAKGAGVKAIIANTGLSECQARKIVRAARRAAA